MRSLEAEESSSGPWTVAQAQEALVAAVDQLLGIEDALERVYKGLPPPADLNDRHEYEKPFDVATEVLATIECVLADNVRPAIRDLQRVAQVTAEELSRDFFDRRSRGPS